MAQKPKNKFYVVEIEPNHYKVFTNWPECQRLVHGSAYLFAGGVTQEEAKRKIARVKWARKNGTPITPGAANKKKTPKAVGSKPTVGLCSDAGTHGNPGPCEAQVCDLNGKVLAHKHLGVHSNNYAEMAGIGMMIQCAIEHHQRILWTDSKIAMGWIAKGKLGPTVHEPDKIMAMIHKIQRLLQEHPHLELRKWDTKHWGEIPADFGRKG